MYLYVDKCFIYLEYYFVFNKGKVKLRFFNKDFLFFFWFFYDDFVMVFKDVIYIRIVIKIV